MLPIAIEELKEREDARLNSGESPVCHAFATYRR
jgi:hypothetical protein